MSPVGAGQGGLHAGEFQQFRQLGGGAIQQASQATGASFNYLLATAQVESGLNPQAGASTSSARGLFQFIETTWLATIKQAGAALGFGRYADAISRPLPAIMRCAIPRCAARSSSSATIPTPTRSWAAPSPRVTLRPWASGSAARPARASFTLRIFLGWAAQRGSSGLPQQSECQGRRLFSECGAGKPFDLLRSIERGGPKPRPGARYPHRPL